jgi:uncharacterized protein YfiM (DUF2279 family)
MLADDRPLCTQLCGLIHQHTVDELLVDRGRMFYACGYVQRPQQSHLGTGIILRLCENARVKSAAASPFGLESSGPLSTAPICWHADCSTTSWFWAGIFWTTVDSSHLLTGWLLNDIVILGWNLPCHCRQLPSADRLTAQRYRNFELESSGSLSTAPICWQADCSTISWLWAGIFWVIVDSSHLLTGWLLNDIVILGWNLLGHYQQLSADTLTAQRYRDFSETFYRDSLKMRL